MSINYLSSIPTWIWFHYQRHTITWLFWFVACLWSILFCAVIDIPPCGLSRKALPPTSLQKLTRNVTQHISTYNFVFTCVSIWHHFGSISKLSSCRWPAEFILTYLYVNHTNIFQDCYNHSTRIYLAKFCQFCSQLRTPRIHYTAAASARHQHTLNLSKLFPRYPRIVHFIFLVDYSYPFWVR